MSKAQNRNIGEMGERIAEEFLKKKGYQIIERNWRSKFGEIDLICQKDKALVFVEVKTKRGEGWGSPEEMEDRRKLEKVRRMGEVYMANHTSEQARFMARVDVVAIVLNYDRSVARIDHYENVY